MISPNSRKRYAYNRLKISGIMFCILRLGPISAYGAKRPASQAAPEQIALRLFGEKSREHWLDLLGEKRREHWLALVWRTEAGNIEISR